MVRRLCLASLTVALCLIASAIPAAAGRTWCARDPLVSLNGVPVQILVAVPSEYVPAVNGPIVVTVQTPARVQREVLFTDAGFNRHGERVSFATLPSARIAPDGSFEVRISAQVPVDAATLLAINPRSSTIPVQLQVVANGALQFANDGTPLVLGGEIWTVSGTRADLYATITVHPALATTRSTP